MLKTTLLASAIATAALFGTSATASAHPTGYWHRTHHVKPIVGVSKYAVKRNLQRRGYYRVHVGSRMFRGYRVTACRYKRRYRMGVSKWGRILWSSRAGYCGGHRPFRRYGRHAR